MEKDSIWVPIERMAILAYLFQSFAARCPQIPPTCPRFWLLQFQRHFPQRNAFDIFVISLGALRSVRIFQTSPLPSLASPASQLPCARKAFSPCLFSMLTCKLLVSFFFREPSFLFLAGTSLFSDLLSNLLSDFEHSFTVSSVFGVSRASFSNVFWIAREFFHACIECKDSELNALCVSWICLGKSVQDASGEDSLYRIHFYAVSNASVRSVPPRSVRSNTAVSLDQRVFEFCDSLVQDLMNNRNQVNILETNTSARQQSSHQDLFY